ncbi:MAG: FAD-dependent oxidoreductase [candidate division KSB1 bacterium]|nr:FAD-dependent oxidoreductase [candidate division KSB1 bacterium]
METIAVKLLSRYVIAAGTMAFELEKPEGFGFQAGQHTIVQLPELKYEDKKGASRPFTIASAPGAGTLLIVTRQTGSGFKKTWQELPLESEIRITPAKGELVLDQDKPAVFLTGGIGITPFRSMILDNYHEGVETPLTLLYSNKTAETAAFHSFFTRMIKDFPALNYVPTLTETNTHHNDWNGEKRMLDDAFVRDYVNDLTVPV